MPDNKLKILAKLIQSRKQEIPYTVLLGSALSMTPDVLKELGCEDWDAFYEVMKHRSSDEWYSLLKEPFDTLHLQEGYRCLAQLLKAGYFNIVLTANFDPFLERAIEVTGFSNGEISTLIKGEHTTSYIVNMLKRSQPRIKICLLRGRLHARTIPNVSETLQFDEQLAIALKDYLVRDMIVLGASNRDTDIIRYIPPQGGSLWLVSSEPAIPDQWKLLQQSHSGEIIIGEDGNFNRFFCTLADLSGQKHVGYVETPQKLSFELSDALQNKQGNQPIQVAITVLYTHLPSGVIDLYDSETMPLLKYEIFNNTAHPIKVALEAEIEDFSFRRIDTVDIAPKSPHTVYQLPRIKAEKAKELTDIRLAVVHTKVEYQQDGVMCLGQRKDFEVYLTARNVIRWAIPDSVQGSGHIPLLQHIAAWVTPRTSPVKEMLRKAADYTPSLALEGYPEAYNPEFVRNQVKAIYIALQKAGLTYINSPFALGPANGEERQMVRLPNESLHDRSANCIDGAVLYASLMELAALEPIIVMKKEHAFVGWKTWRGTEIYEFLETTMTREATFEASFSQGMQEYEQLVAEKQFSREIFDPEGFARLLDIKALHDEGIYPMMGE